MTSSERNAKFIFRVTRSKILYEVHSKTVENTLVHWSRDRNFLKVYSGYYNIFLSTFVFFHQIILPPPSSMTGLPSFQQNTQRC